MLVILLCLPPAATNRYFTQGHRPVQVKNPISGCFLPHTASPTARYARDAALCAVVQTGSHPIDAPRNPLIKGLHPTLNSQVKGPLTRWFKDPHCAPQQFRPIFMS